MCNVVVYLLRKQRMPVDFLSAAGAFSPLARSTELYLENICGYTRAVRMKRHEHENGTEGEEQRRPRRHTRRGAYRARVEPRRDDLFLAELVGAQRDELLVDLAQLGLAHVVGLCSPSASWSRSSTSIGQLRSGLRSFSASLSLTIFKPSGDGSTT